MIDSQVLKVMAPVNRKRVLIMVTGDGITMQEPRTTIIIDKEILHFIVSAHLTENGTDIGDEAFRSKVQTGNGLTVLEPVAVMTVNIGMIMSIVVG